MANADWRRLTAPVLFDQDHAAWRKKVKLDSNLAESVMTWSDISDHTRNAYTLCADLGSTYSFLSHKGRLPIELPDECTPAGFYRAAVASRDRQVGVQRDELDVKPFCELSEFSRFIYTRIADRLRALVEVDDGLESDLIEPVISDGLEF